MLSLEIHSSELQTFENAFGKALYILLESKIGCSQNLQRSVLINFS